MDVSLARVEPKYGIDFGGNDRTAVISFEIDPIDQAIVSLDIEPVTLSFSISPRMHGQRKRDRLLELLSSIRVQSCQVDDGAYALHPCERVFRAIDPVELLSYIEGRHGNAFSVVDRLVHGEVCRVGNLWLRKRPEGAKQ